MAQAIHTPVLLDAVIRYLNPQPGRRYVDATADGGGHAAEILKRIQPNGKLLAIEWDGELAAVLQERLQRTCPGSSKSFVLCQANFSDLARCARSAKFGPAAGILFDLGASSFHFEASRRGFSFRGDEPLDMRYSRTMRDTAADLLNRCSPATLAEMFRDFGGERFADRIAGAIVRERQRRPIERTGELAAVVRRAVPPPARHGRTHVATRVFQALRIAVNREFENIAAGLRAATDIVAPRGRIVVIAFHSGEDRIVKQFFRGCDTRQHFRAVTEKPIRPSLAEIAANPRSRSARLRVFEKLP